MINKTHFFLLVTAVIFSSCKKSNEEILEGYVTFSSVQTLSSNSKVGESVISFSKAGVSTENPLQKLRSKPDDFDIKPFERYLDRDFYAKAISSTFNLASVPGHIYKKIKEGEYRRVTDKRMVLEGAYPAVKSIDYYYFNDKITERKQLNAATTILGINRNEKMIVETVVKDIMTTQLSDTIINFAVLKAFAEIKKEKEPDNLDDYYFASGATIGTVSHRVMVEQSFTRRINLNWVTANKNTFGTSGQFALRRDVVLEMTPLKDKIDEVEAWERENKN